MGLIASDVDALKHRSFTACTPDELAALRRIMARIRLTPPRRRTRRTRSGPNGRAPDLRKTIRESMRMHGEPAQMFWRERRVKLRPLILILDISGSMADFSRHLLQFAFTAKHAAARVEVFCFGTRLTRITRELEHRRPDSALEQAARAVVDWDGGTQDRRVPGHVCPALGTRRDVPRRGGGDLLGRARPRRPRGAGRGDGTAVQAVPSHRLAQPAQGRTTGCSGPVRWA